MTDEPIDHASRYNELPVATREFIEGLDGDTISFIQRWIIVVKAAGIVGRLVFWFIAVLVGIVVGIPTLFEAVSKIASWLHKGG